MVSAILASSVVGLLIWGALRGRSEYRILRAQVESGVSGAWERFVKRSATRKVITVALACAALATNPERLPFTLPHAETQTTFSWLAYVAALFGVSTLVLRRRGDRLLGLLVRTAGALLPRTRRQRQLFIGVSLLAGVGEEIIFRWFLMSAFITFLGASFWESLCASSIAFGLAHLYQGRWGILATGIMGASFALLWWVTGSLLVPMVFHFLADARISWLVTPERIERIQRRLAK